MTTNRQHLQHLNTPEPHTWLSRCVYEFHQKFNQRQNNVLGTSGRMTLYDLLLIF